MSIFDRWRRRRLEGRRIGRRGERLAARFLRRRGLRILERNVRCGRGEIDLLALEGQTLVFVEVKSRTDRSWRSGLEKIDRDKRRALRRACRRYLAAIDWSAESYRVDAVTVDFDLRGWVPRLREIRWYRDVVDLD